MSKSPYDSLTTGSENIKPAMEYVEVDLDELIPAQNAQPQSAPREMQHVKSKPPLTKPKTPLANPPQYSHLSIKNIAGTNSFNLPFEESLLVPDTMPDMERVLFTEGRVDLSQPSKLSYGSDDFLTGNITVFTVYKPASGGHDSSSGPIDVVKSVIPFKTDKCWLGDGDSYKVSASIGSLTAEMVNERKFVVRGNILIKLTIISAKNLKVFKGCNDEDLVVRNSRFTTSELLHEITETTEISQEITVKEGEPAPVKILKESFEICESHRQISSGKLVVHGIIHSQVLYSGIVDESPTLACLDNKTDFTQFILLKENVDPNMIMVHFTGNDLKMSIENRDKFMLTGNVTSHIQVYGNRTIDVATDAYHKKSELVFDTEIQLLNSIVGTVSGELSSREVIDLSNSELQNLGEINPQNLLCGSCSITTLDTHLENDRIIIEGTLPISLLAMDENGTVFTIDKKVPLRGSLSISLATSSQIQLHVDSSVRNFWFNKINNRQIEVNITLALTVWAFHEEEFCTLENLCFAEDVQSTRRGSMAIYVASNGETLWDIAKKYRTDVPTLADSNGLSEDEILAEGSKLFICR